MPAGYSGTPLAKKLGFANIEPVFVRNMPDSVQAEIERTARPEWRTRMVNGLGAAHIFHTSTEKLETDLKKLRRRIDSAGFVWVSWPKKASKVSTDITEDTIREIALPLGFVDVKVCAVDAVWSGLKLVIRKELR